MKVAFSIWNERVAPVFDIADLIYLVDAADRERVPMERHHIAGLDGAQLLAWLQQHAVQVLICGALSRPLQEMLENAGIEVIPFVSGPFNAVLQGWMAGRLDHDSFAMPGCCGRRRGRGYGRQGATGCNRRRQERRKGLR